MPSEQASVCVIRINKGREVKVSQEGESAPGSRIKHQKPGDRNKSN